MCNNCGCNADPFAFNAEKKNCGCGQDPCITYGAEKTVPLNYTPDIAPYAGAFEKMEVTFKIQDADYATFYYTTEIPSGLRRHSDEHIVSYVWGDECKPQDDNWFYCPYDWNGVGEHYLAKVMNKTLKAESLDKTYTWSVTMDAVDEDDFADAVLGISHREISAEAEEVENAAESFAAEEEEEDWMYHVYVVDDASFGDMYIVDNARDFGTQEEAIKAAHEVSKDERGKGKTVYVVAEERDMDIEEVIYTIDEEGDVLNAESFGAEDMDGRVVNIVGVEDKVYVTIRFPDTNEHYGYDKIFVGEMEDVMLAESFGAEKVNFVILGSKDIEGVGIVTEGSPYLKNYYGEMDEYNIYDDDAAEEIMSIPVNDPRYPLKKGEMRLIEAMVYGFNHPRINDSREELNEDGMFWAGMVRETLANYSDSPAESFGAESLEDLDKSQLIDLIKKLEDRDEYVKDYVEKAAESFGAEGMNTVRCNKCMWEGEEEDLVMFEDEDGFGKGCPKCETDAYLMDLKAESFGAESEIDRYNKHMDEILEVKARLLEENIEDYDPNDPEQEAENNAIYEVFSKYYPDIYGAESFGAEMAAEEVAEFYMITFEIRDGDRESYYRTIVPPDIANLSDEKLIISLTGDNDIYEEGYKDYWWVFGEQLWRVDGKKAMSSDNKKLFNDYGLYAESFGAEYGKRQRFGNRYVGRDTKGKFISNVSVGRSLKADRRTKSKTPARSGFGHKGDTQKGASGGFKLPTDAKSVIGIGAVLGGLWAYLESKA